MIYFCKLFIYLFSYGQDYILIELSQSGLKGSSEPSVTETQEDEVVLVVNPNYTLED